MLKDTKLSPSFDLVNLARQASGYSGSDLKELCRNAAMVPMREFMREAGEHPEVLAKAEESVCLVRLVSEMRHKYLTSFHRISSCGPSQ